MILDERTEFADAVSVAAAAGTVLVGDVINTQQNRDLGQGHPIYLVIQANTEIITGGGAGTIRFQLVSDAQAAIATDGSATVHFDTGNITTGAAGANDNRLNAGSIIACVALPFQGPAYEQYIGLLAIIGTAAVTAGSINAFMTLDPSRWTAIRMATGA